MTDTEVPKMALSDYNLNSITTEQYEEILKGAIETHSNVAVFGRRGGGKTVIAKDVVQNNTFFETRSKVREVYCNLSTCERPDMGGYPDMFGLSQEKVNNSEEARRQRFVNYVLPLLFKPMMTEDQRIVAIFDEIDKADPSIHAPLLEIFQFRTINGKALPNLVACIATGNLISEGSQRPSLPLLDRTEKYLLKPDMEGFKKFSGKSGKIHPSVLAFLLDHPNFLFGSEDGCGDNYAEPSPRTWEMSSRVLSLGEKLGWNKDLLNLKVAGFVGKEAGIKYEIYYNHYQELLPLVNNVFAGLDVRSHFDSLDPSKQLYSAMIACARLSNILEDPKYSLEAPPIELRHVGNFMRLLSDENILISVRTQLCLPRLVKWKLPKNPDWAEILRGVTTSSETKF
jgi:hypothetical protein